MIRKSRPSFASMAPIILGSALLASLAWVGHAAGERGADHIVHVSADAAHLFAAGAWRAPRDGFIAPGDLICLAQLFRPPAFGYMRRYENQ